MFGGGCGGALAGGGGACGCAGGPCGGRCLPASIVEGLWSR